MKKNLLLSALAVAFLAIGCKKDDKDNGKNPNPPAPTLAQVIVGTWTIEDLKLDGTAEILGAPVVLQGQGSNYRGNAQFKADGSISSNAGADVAITAIIGGIPIPLPNEDLDFDDLFDGSTYVVKSNTELELTDDGETRSVKVVAFTATSMTLEIEDEDVDEGVAFKFTVKLKK